MTGLQGPDPLSAQSAAAAAAAISTSVKLSTSVQMHASNNPSMPGGLETFAVKMFLFAFNCHYLAYKTLLGYFLAPVAASGPLSRRSIQARQSVEALAYRSLRDALR
jgi:hypothetical protein